MSRAELSVNCLLLFPFVKKKEDKKTPNFRVVSQRRLDPLIIKLTASIRGDVRTSRSGAERSRRHLLNSPQGPLRAKWERGDGRLKQPVLCPPTVFHDFCTGALISGPLNILIFRTNSDPGCQVRD